MFKSWEKRERNRVPAAFLSTHSCVIQNEVKDLRMLLTVSWWSYFRIGDDSLEADL
jgi:hypothetical protein